MKRFLRRDKCEEGAVVLEAAISLPVFMFFIVTILSIINICIAQSRIQIALNETAKEISEYSYFFSLTGLDEIQKINYDESGETRDNLTNVLDGITTTYGGFQNIATGVSEFEINESVFDNIESTIDTIDENVDTIDEALDNTMKTLETMASDPKSLMIGVARIGINELVEEVKSQFAALMTKGLIQKHLMDKADGDVDEYLMHLGIVDGLDGIDFTGSLIFLNGSDDIILVAEYNLPLIKLLNNDIELHFVQSAPTKAWSAKKVLTGSGTVVVSGNGDAGDGESNESAGEEGKDGTSGENADENSGNGIKDGTLVEGGAESAGDGVKDSTSVEGGAENADGNIAEPNVNGDAPQSGEGSGMVVGVPVPTESHSVPADKVIDPNKLSGAELEAYMVSEYDQASVDLIKSLADTSNWTYQDWNNFIDEYTSPKQGGGLEYAACFAAGTPVITKSGIIPIEDIAVGMEVLAGLEDGEIAYKKVLNTYEVTSSSIVIVSTPNGSITATRTHLFFTEDRGYVTAGNLRAGDVLRNADNERMPVVEVEYCDTEIKVYNFEVEDFHSYFVGDDRVLVHNECNVQKSDKSKPLESVNYDSKQVGKKYGEHMKDYPDMKDYTDYIDYADEIFNSPDKIIRDEINGEIYYIKGNDLLRIKENGDFVSLYPGANSTRVINAIKNGGLIWP